MGGVEGAELGGLKSVLKPGDNGLHINCGLKRVRSRTWGGTMTVNRVPADRAGRRDRSRGRLLRLAPQPRSSEPPGARTPW